MRFSKGQLSVASLLTFGFLDIYFKTVTNQHFVWAKHCILSLKRALLVIASLKSIFMKQNASK